MIENKTAREKTIVVGIKSKKDAYDSLGELKQLAETAGAEVVGEMTQVRQNVDSRYYIGKGKLDELKRLLDENDADCVIFDGELSGMQIKNIEDITDAKVLDRTSVILDIFAQRARSKEGKLQVELAQLKHQLPRLIGSREGLSRTGAGIGTRGPGETKLEMDRSVIRKKISTLKKRIEEIQKNRDTQRVLREKNDVPTVAIVGYTNAGKSTLINVLTHSDIYAENKLFATLDPTARSMVLPSGNKVILVDTVGFIQKIPHDLVEAFKSTLEECTYAKLLLNVVDASDPQMDMKIEVVKKVLKDIGAGEIPCINIYNKIDMMNKINVLTANDLTISALKGYGLDNLKQAIDKTVFNEVEQL